MYNSATIKTSNGIDCFLIDEECNVTAYFSIFYKVLYTFEGFEDSQLEKFMVPYNKRVNTTYTVKLWQEKFEIRGVENKDVMDMLFGRWLLRIPKNGIKDV